MSRSVVVVGAGMGGLVAAVRLARAGARVTVVEARSSAGGLASAADQDGLRFDAGPYIVLDRPSLEWAFGRVGLDLDAEVSLKRIDDIYEVTGDDHPPIRFWSDLERTAAGFDVTWPGSGARYIKFVETTAATYQRLRPMLQLPSPKPWHLVRNGGWRDAPFLLRPLGSVLANAELPAPLIQAVAIWTHIAGQRLAEAPSPLAFVPSLLHKVGAYYPVGGMAALPAAIAKAATRAGVEFRFQTKVRAISSRRGRVTGVLTENDEHLLADAVISNASGVGTYLELAEGIPATAKEKIKALPLQSPGVCAYLAAGGPGPPPYLHFKLTQTAQGEGRVRCLVLPGVMDPSLQHGDEWPARLISPMDHARAEGGGEPTQRAHLDAMLAESWWRERTGAARVVATRLPAQWGREFHLHRDSMNPVMTAQFMRQGRLGHTSPHLAGLYLAGSSTHPGQWVSFCAVSGILAADALMEKQRR